MLDYLEECDEVKGAPRIQPGVVQVQSEAGQRVSGRNVNCSWGEINTRGVPSKSKCHTYRTSYSTAHIKHPRRLTLWSQDFEQTCQPPMVPLRKQLIGGKKTALLIIRVEFLVKASR
ncbi:hypothetical protein LUW87_02720 [Rhabdothermincola sp. EGI L10124]|nr:hypothetical protein [Rhabdothermincola salaria]MCD9622757.1 hypothetical protein [Rhabdothermincola salaria]